MIRNFGYAAYLERVRVAAGSVARVASGHAASISRLRTADGASAGILGFAVR
jgi:hypothetical protein